MEADEETDGAAIPLPARAARGGVRGWLADAHGLGVDGPPELLAAVDELRPEAWLRRIPGRETFVWPGRPELVVKRYLGGEQRDWWFERLRGEPRSPGRREGENLIGLEADGVAVPRALAWAEDETATKRTRAGRSVLVMARVEHDTNLRERVAQASADERRAWADALLALVAHLHVCGWYHRDLYLQHFVVRADGTLALLDVGRARQQSSPRRRWFVKDLAALLHSTPRVVTEAERLRFLTGWLSASTRAGASDARWWTRAVLSKARRLAAHVPNHVDPRTSGADSE